MLNKPEYTTKGVRYVKLLTLTIEGFRRHLHTRIDFSDATFLVGENNVGKSSVLLAIYYLLNDIKLIPEVEFFTSENGDYHAQRIVLTAEFGEIPSGAKTWLGFKGRVLPFTSEGGETDYKVVYRKTFEVGAPKYRVELRQQVRTLKFCFASCTTAQQYLEAGLDESQLEEKLGTVDREKRLSKTEKTKVEELEELYDYDENTEEWFENPGGIPANVLQRMPKFLLIPAQDKVEELSGSSGTLTTTLAELFNDVRDMSPNYKEAQRHLDLLAAELDPKSEDSEFGMMMKELNDVMNDVFPNTGILAETTLSEADHSIKPQFKITMFSNINTPVSLQGTGMIRSAVFALLRYRNLRDNRRTQESGHIVRPLLIGFEEPELYLHPNAAEQMRNTIYDLASSAMNQIVCTTHSPYMIDLSKKTAQTLNAFSIASISTIGDQEYTSKAIKCSPFNTTLAYRTLQDDDKSHVKMILKIDDLVSRVFFSRNVLIVEGDTEDIVLRETITRLPESVRTDVQYNWQIIKARGKAAIIPLVKYLQAMDIAPIVMHDEDSGNTRAEVFNQPILDAIGDSSRVVRLSNCIEDVLGYTAPSKDKPFTAYKFIVDNWDDDWDKMPDNWKEVVQTIFRESFGIHDDDSYLQSAATQE